jgi:hypothetical protein
VQAGSFDPAATASVAKRRASENGMASPRNNSAATLRRQSQNAAIAFAVSVALGATIPVARKLLCGDSDPFQSSWPLFLQVAACLSAFAVSWKWRQSTAAAVGLYVGLAGYLLILGNPEYPGSSLIALAVHGFAPALVGSLIALVVHYHRTTW